MANFQPLHKETHGNVKLKKPTNVAGLKTTHALGVVVQEFALAGNQYPIAFVKDQSGEGYFPVAIMGLEQNKNLFVNDQDQFEGMYIPARFTHQPLSVVPNKDDATLFGIAIDMDHELVSESEGEALFNEDGSESETLETRKKALMAYVENEHITKAFVDAVKQYDLFHEQNLNVKVKDKEYNLTGLHLINEKKLNELSDEAFLDLRKRGFLAPIFAVLGSMHQVTKLIRLQADKL